MFDGFFRFGGNEVGNSARAYGYTQTADCPVAWLADPRCDTVREAEQDDAYEHDLIESAPWYDVDAPDVSSRFYGLYVIDIRGLSDSTRTASNTQRTGDGSKVSGYRHTSREVRVRAWLTAEGMDALEAGMTWLRNVLEPNACGVHGGACGKSDLSFFVQCPPDRGDGESDEDYQARIAGGRRYLHDVSAISGPLVIQERVSRDNRVYGRLVEFSFVAEVPFVYGAPKTLALIPSVPTVKQDTLYNRAPYPSAELSAGAVIVATNYTSNPSLETDATGWAAGSDGIVIQNANLTSGRVTGELSAAGPSSYRSVFTAPGASASAGAFYNQFETDLSARPANSRVSINIWSAELVMGGAPVRGPIRVQALWRATAGGAVMRTDELGTIPVDGGVISAKSIVPPVGANFVLVRATAQLTSWNAGTIVRLYSDALAVSVP